MEWQILATTVCLHHGLLLVDECQKCGKKLTIFDIVQGQCGKCYFDLSTSDSIDVASDRFSLVSQRILSGWMGIGEPVPLIPGISPDTLYRVFSGIRYCLQTKADWKYLHAFPEYTESLPSKKELARWVVPNKYLHRLNVSAIKPLIDFPNGMYSFWDAYREPNPSVSIALGLGNLYWGWIEKRWLSQDFEFIQNAFDDYLVSRVNILNKGIAKSRRLQKKPELKTKFEYISYSLAAKELNSTAPKVMRLVKAKMVEGNICTDRKKTKVVSQKDILEYSDKLAKSVTLDRTCEILRISPTLAKSFIRHNLLEAIGGRTYDNSPQWAITLKSIRELLDNLREVVIRVSSDELKEHSPLVTISRQLAGWGFEVGDILSDVINGKLQGYVDYRYPVTITSIHLLNTTPRDIKQKIISEGNWISEHDFANEMSVKPTTLHKWAKAGLIQPIKRVSVTNYYTKSCADDFKRKYINSKQVSDLLQVGVLTVQKWARIGRLKPVSGGEINGCHEYLFLKSDVQKMIRENRLTAPQMANRLGISRSKVLEQIRSGKLHPISGPGIDDSKHFLFLISD
ncbi:hypothetical protein ADM99_04940 [Leptolinea tardivitalis]|uniref:Helix-turn-helix domain-containing protein n=2 Tax=Leptolinea tardivitalis TaxID=229920 RepID=A0A0P6XCA5_9CHLR|nr:hypothetical protein ADM99_04940 [Leptolinea tardivitalis]